MSRMLSKGFRIKTLSSQFGSRRKLSILLILTVSFIVLVMILAWFALDRVKEKIKADVGDALQIVLHTTQESLNLWVESNKSQLIRLAEDPRLVSLTEQQLRVPRDQISLFESKTLMEIRVFFRRHRDRERLTEFFVISPDFTNISSMYNNDIGSKNLIASQALDLLNRVFQGEAVLVPPVWSDVPLDAASEGKSASSPTMFFAAPIKDKQGNVIAAVAQSVVPTGDFTRLIQLGRLGKSGETYAFGAYGKLLSKSRFEKHLIKAGMISEGQTSILSVSVRDPGGDTTRGFRPSAPRYQHPLTLMAEQATKGKSGLNVAGYRDYRGVRVYGAWLWDDNLGVGLATEIDEADALGPYFTTRVVILTVLGATVLLALGSLVLAVLIDVRAKRSLQKSHDELELRVGERTAELKEKQARLEQAEERSRLLLESVQEGIFGVGEDGLVNFVNPAGLAMLGYESDELIRQKIHQMIHHTRPDGSPYPIEECPMHHSLTRGVIGSRDDEVLWRKDGTSFHVEYTSVPIRKDDQIAGTVVVFRDISERKQAEEALRASRATARGLLDATQESLLLLDKDGIIIAVNRTAAARHQQTPEELIRKNRFDILPPNLRKSRKAHFKNVLLTGNPEDFEDVRDGKIFRHIYYPVRDKDGTIMGVAIFAQDITERKQAEEALRESEINMRTIFENSPLGMIHFSKDGTIIDCNDMFIDLMGSSRKELIGFNTPKQTNDEKLRAAIIKALAGETAEYEGHYTSVTGSKTASLRIVFNPTEPGTSPTEVIATLENITERKRAEEAIRESQERLSTILKTTNQGFWLVDNDTVTLDVNEAMCEILDRTKKDIIGKKIYDFLDEETREIFREQNRMRKKGIHSLYEISLIRSDGGKVPCLMNASPLIDADGNVVGSFGMTTNIAERKQMEEDLRRNVDELERFSKVAYGREKKMIQLKQEINELMVKSGKDEKYKIVS